MSRIPLAQAKNRFSEIVDRVERRGETIVILRHGKAVARLVPALPSKKPRRITQEELDAIWAECDAVTKDIPAGAVADLIAGRR